MADSEARASVFMNRRIRNRTSGGVGGRRGWKHPRLLPDVRPAGRTLQRVEVPSRPDKGNCIAARQGCPP